MSVRGQSLWNVKESFKCNKSYITRKSQSPGDLRRFLLVCRNEKFMGCVESCPRECSSVGPDALGLRRKIGKAAR